MASSIPVNVVEHSFGLFDGYDIPIETADWSTGLIVELANGAMIYTGLNRGPVQVAVDVRAVAPDNIDSSAWDDIVEATVHGATGNLTVQLLEYGRFDEPPRLPLLSPYGPGSYRLRAHAHGRDLHYDSVQELPNEQYLLTIWPAEPSPSLIIRATDQCGYGVRLSAAQAPKGIPLTPLSSASSGPDRQRRNLLEGAARAELSVARQVLAGGPAPDKSAGAS